MVRITTGESSTEDILLSSEFPNGIRRSDYQKIREIEAEADYRYPITKGCCRLEKQKLRYLKQRYIEKKMLEFGLKEVDNKVNS